MDHVTDSARSRSAARVFLSYAAEDVGSAQRLASILTDRGWDVWWDRRLFAGTSFDEVIEEQLDAARAVIVLWSTTSAQSEWVRAEATAAVERDVLIPILIEPCRVPLRFRNVHTLDLSEWDGEPVDDRLQELERALENLQRAEVVDEPRAAPAAPDRAGDDDRSDEVDVASWPDERSTTADLVDDTATVGHEPWFRWPYAVVAVGAVALIIGLIALVTGSDSSPTDQQPDPLADPRSTTVEETSAPSRDDDNEPDRTEADVRSDGLDVGDWMYVGDSRVSTNGRFRLCLQDDGNLVVEDNDDPPAPPIWASGTYGHPNAGALMQPDGNFVIFGDRSSGDLVGTVVFQTGTAGNAGAVLTIRNDGALVVESPSGAVLFDSND